MPNKPFLSPAIIFSEKVITEAGTGKLSIINSFQRFYGHEFPFATPPFFVTVSFGGLSGKVEKLKLAVEMVDESGAPVLEPLTAEVGTGLPVTPEETFELSFFLASCQFEKPGVHRVLVRIDNKIVGERNLPGALMAPPAVSSPPAPPRPKATNSKKKK